MSHPYHHALSSVRKWGGTPDDYLPIHNWFDETKSLMADFRHRALRHHAEGIFLCEQIFGVTLELTTCKHCGEAKVEHWTRNGDSHAFTPKLIPTRWVGEQHVKEDFGGRIPSAVDFLRAIRPEPWMSPKIDSLETGGQD